MPHPARCTGIRRTYLAKTFQRSLLTRRISEIRSPSFSYVLENFKINFLNFTFYISKLKQNMRNRVEYENDSMRERRTSERKEFVANRKKCTRSYDGAKSFQTHQE